MAPPARPALRDRVALGAASAYYLAISSEAGLGWVYSAGLFCLALAWTSTTAMAFVAIRRRAIPQHREWMIRSYVVTFAFVLFRMMIPAFALLGVSEPREQYTAAAWLCWAVPLLVVEPLLQWRKLHAQTTGSRLQGHLAARRPG